MLGRVGRQRSRGAGRAVVAVGAVLVIGQCIVVGRGVVTHIFDLRGRLPVEKLNQQSPAPVLTCWLSRRHDRRPCPRDWRSTAPKTI